MPNTFALGYDSIDEFVTDVQCGGGDSIDFDYNHARRLLAGAVLVSEVRAAVFEETGKTMTGFCFYGVAIIYYVYLLRMVSNKIILEFELFKIKSIIFRIIDLSSANF